MDLRKLSIKLKGIEFKENKQKNEAFAKYLMKKFL
jgi:hypothetical protein